MPETCAAHRPDFSRLRGVVQMHVRQFRRHRMQQDVVASSSFLAASSCEPGHLGRSQLPPLGPCRPAVEAIVSLDRSTALTAVATSSRTVR